MHPNSYHMQRTLEREVRQCQALVIWTDCDREGENIGFEVIDVCKAGGFSFEIVHGAVQQPLVKFLELSSRVCLTVLAFWRGFGGDFVMLCFISTVAVKPNLQVFRAHFSEITPNSIRRACQTLTEPNINISDAVDVRQELDLRIGEYVCLFLL